MEVLEILGDGLGMTWRWFGEGLGWFRHGSKMVRDWLEDGWEIGLGWFEDRLGMVWGWLGDGLGTVCEDLELF